jgi:hypothetical protein
MHIHLAPRSIEALAVIISGGGSDQTLPIGIYGSASKLESFMAATSRYRSGPDPGSPL